MLDLLSINPFSVGNKEIIFLPQGLAMLLAVVEQQGHKITNLDLHNKKLPPETIIGTLASNRFDACLISGLAPQVFAMREITALVRTHSPRTKVVLGGVGVSDLPEEILLYTGADVVVSGEAEAIIGPLLCCLEAGSPLTDIPSITYRTPQGQVVRNPLTPPVADLDSLPMPAYHYFDVDHICQHSYNGEGRSMSILTSRGCPFRCTFCIQSVKTNVDLLTEIHGGVTGHKNQYTKMRYRSPDKVMAEARFLKETYHLDFLFLYDEEFLTSTKHMASICAVMRTLGFTFATSGRADLMTHEKARLLKSSGCKNIFFGIESGSQQILDGVNKQVRVEKIASGIKAAQEEGLHFFPNFILGLPGETRETVRESIEFCKSNKLEFAPSYFTLYPNSLIFHQYRQNTGDLSDYFKKLSHTTYAWDVATNITELPDAELKSLRNNGLAETVAHRLAGHWGTLAVLSLEFILRGAILFLQAIPEKQRMMFRNLWFL